MQGMKATILMIAVVSLVGCVKKKKLIADAVVEKVIRGQLGKHTGELTKADLEKVTSLTFSVTRITDVGLRELVKLPQLTRFSLNGCTQITDAGLEKLAKLTQLKELCLFNTGVTKTGVTQLEKVLPECEIPHSVDLHHGSPRANGQGN